MSGDAPDPRGFWPPLGGWQEVNGAHIAAAQALQEYGAEQDAFGRTPIFADGVLVGYFHAEVGFIQASEVPLPPPISSDEEYPDSRSRGDYVPEGAYVKGSSAKGSGKGKSSPGTDSRDGSQDDEGESDHEFWEAWRAEQHADDHASQGEPDAEADVPTPTNPHQVIPDDEENTPGIVTGTCRRCSRVTLGYCRFCIVDGARLPPRTTPMVEPMGITWYAVCNSRLAPIGVYKGRIIDHYFHPPFRFGRLPPWNGAPAVRAFTDLVAAVDHVHFSHPALWACTVYSHSAPATFWAQGTSGSQGGASSSSSSSSRPTGT
jgi:hypothetical protein